MTALQVKNVPDELHAKLRARAARQGRSVSSYVLAVLKDDLERPGWEEWLTSLDAREPVRGLAGEDIVEALDEARDEREGQLERAFRDRH
jgi:plasmid stability protein